MKSHPVPLSIPGRLGDSELLLGEQDGRLTLWEASDRSRKGLCVDFRRIDARPHTLGRKNALAKAIRGCETVIDTTAGLAGDAYLLRCMGKKVTAIERIPVLAALIEDGIRRGLEDPEVGPRVKADFRILTGDARELLPSLGLQADAVLVDPMYPRRPNASALPKKPLRLLRLLAGEDDDAESLFDVARKAARRRVIVKRPHHAPPLGGPPDTVFESKLVRFDVYLQRGATSDA